MEDIDHAWGAGGVSWGDTGERMGLGVCGNVDEGFGRTRRGLFRWSVALSSGLEILAVEESYIGRGWVCLHCPVFVNVNFGVVAN